MMDGVIIVESISGTCVPVKGDDIDTDRIIPARFMKVVTFEGLGEYAFNDERFDGKGGMKPHPFNSESYAGASILLVNKNFGCGSSREHAPQALMRWGIKAVIGESFAEIFAGNCTSMGIPAVTVSADTISQLMQSAEEEPARSLTLDLRNSSITFSGAEYPAVMEEARRKAFLSGSWDSTSVLLENLILIEQKYKELFGAEAGSV